MATIFTNASVTIIASQGNDANYGLRGLRGISSPRNSLQKELKLEKGLKIIQILKGPGWMGDDSSHTWHKRGWTFQEELFSQRTLTFANDSVQWDYACSTVSVELERCSDRLYWRRDIESIYRSRKILIVQNRIPDLIGFTGLITSFNSREFTYPEDAPTAFAFALRINLCNLYGKRLSPWNMQSLVNPITEGYFVNREPLPQVLSFYSSQLSSYANTSLQAPIRKLP